MKQPTCELGPGERVLERWRANRTQHSQRAVGGHLHLTDRRLLFEPHAFDVILAGRTVSVPLRDISDVGRVPRDLRDFFGGGLRARLAVVTPHGTHLFVVNGLDAKIERIQEERCRAQGQST